MREDRYEALYLVLITLWRIDKRLHHRKTDYVSIFYKKWGKQ